jgi:hypothetical protein
MPNQKSSKKDHANLLVPLAPQSAMLYIKPREDPSHFKATYFKTFSAIRRLDMRLAFVLIMILVSTTATHADIPPLMNYQGQITTEGTLANPIEIHFAIYPNLETGQSLWTETHSISHENGSFSVLLGSRNPFPENLFEAEHRYLEIRVENDTAFRPRQRIVSAAYAFNARQAENAIGHLTPQSIQLGAATIDSAGNLSTPLIQTDSLAVGGIGIIDRHGRWTGPELSNSVPRLALDTLVVKNTQNSFDFGSATWLDIDGTSDVLTAFVNLKETGFLDISFHTTVSATGNDFQTRIVVDPINPDGDPLTDLGNVSQFVPDTSADIGILSNQAAVRVEPGLYKVFVQGQIQGIGTLLSSILTVRVFSR